MLDIRDGRVGIGDRLIIAIDESGSPRAGSRDLVVFVAVHLRQRKTMFRQKQAAFADWEASLPRSLKDSKGEFKGKALNDARLAAFARSVLAPHPTIRISPVLLRPSDSPGDVVEKHRAIQAEGIRRGIEVYAGQDKAALARLYDEFSHWFNNLSYDGYMKVVMLGRCIEGSLVNAFGHAIAGRYELELTRLKYLIDRDFVREERSNAFWHEILRNQIWNQSRQNPLPMVDTWKDDHPVIAAYTRRGRFDLNSLFVDNLHFVKSHESFEVRIADAVATILTRSLNKGECAEAASVVDRCLAGQGGIPRLVLGDVDPSTWDYDPEDNPWVLAPPDGIHWRTERPGDV